MARRCSTRPGWPSPDSWLATPQHRCGYGTNPRGLVRRYAEAGSRSSASACPHRVSGLDTSPSTGSRQTAATPRITAASEHVFECSGRLRADVA